MKGISLSLPEHILEALKKRAEREGCLNVQELIRRILSKEVGAT